MPPIPHLPLGRVSTPKTPNTPRQTPRNDCEAKGVLAISARNIVRPQVGLGAMYSALGEVRAPWGPPTTPRLPTKQVQLQQRLSEEKQVRYHVGESRARQQLRSALTTHDDAARLRRLEQALESVAYQSNRSVRHEFAAASVEADYLSKVLGSTKTAQELDLSLVDDSGDEDDPGLTEEEGGAAAVKIQSMYRGRKAAKQRYDEVEVAMKIQSVYRGKVARGATQAAEDEIAA